jgi:hypothetical protein
MDLTGGPHLIDDVIMRSASIFQESNSRSDGGLLNKSGWLDAALVEAPKSFTLLRISWIGGDSENC